MLLLLLLLLCIVLYRCTDHVGSFELIEVNSGRGGPCTVQLVAAVPDIRQKGVVVWSLTNPPYFFGHAGSSDTPACPIYLCLCVLSLVLGHPLPLPRLAVPYCTG